MLTHAWTTARFVTIGRSCPAGCMPVPGKANTACGYAEDYGAGKQRPEDMYLLAWCSSGLETSG
ncbi:hypothetical protein ACFTZK_21315 [Streptomyces decoyicus]|uniref:hypothetical protein n=1 Tax=Streptomyces decoyicus TaxID=249567 RepID=UPI00363F6C0E